MDGSAQYSDPVHSNYRAVWIHLCFGDRLASAHDFKGKPTFIEDTVLGSAHRDPDDYSFYSLFSLDVFESQGSALELLGGFIVHTIHSIVLIIVLLFAWKRPVVGFVIWILKP